MPPRRRPINVFLILLVLAAAIASVSLLWLAGEAHYRSCIAKAEARYPAVPVSAFTGRQTGPVKVSFVNERAKAISSCTRV
jgi:hypothetical protein